MFRMAASPPQQPVWLHVGSPGKRSLGNCPWEKPGKTRKGPFRTEGAFSYLITSELAKRARERGLLAVATAGETNHPEHARAEEHEAGRLRRGDRNEGS